MSICWYYCIQNDRQIVPSATSIAHSACEFVKFPLVRKIRNWSGFCFVSFLFCSEYIYEQNAIEKKADERNTYSTNRRSSNQITAARRLAQIRKDRANISLRSGIEKDTQLEAQMNSFTSELTANEARKNRIWGATTGERNGDRLHRLKIGIHDIAWWDYRIDTEHFISFSFSHS